MRLLILVGLWVTVCTSCSKPSVADVPIVAEQASTESVEPPSPESPSPESPSPEPLDPAEPDPESTPEGRTVYLGREVAQTMHWRGAPWLLRATREDEEHASKLFDALGVETGQTVCDLGCGNGFHTLRLAEMVGPTGKVLAVDIQPKMLQMLGQRLRAERIDNVESILGTVSDPGLKPGTCDMVLMVDVYHELSHPVRTLGAIRSALAPRGRLVLVEFREEDPEVPIKPEHKMSKAQILLELETNGFQLVESFDDLPLQHVMFFEAAVLSTDGEASIGERRDPK